MKEIRIPYSLPMARARRAGLKTQTRRIVKPQPDSDEATGACWVEIDGRHQWAWHSGEDEDILPNEPRFFCPYGQPGDILLPVEPWRAPVEFNAMPPRDIPSGTPIWLDAQGPAPEAFGRYRHARFMPKKLIQARDELVSVRVERLQDISEADAVAEGTPNSLHLQGGRFANENYAHLWETINGDGSWAANPLVWVLIFKVVAP